MLSIPDKPERGYNHHTLAKDLDGFLRALDLNDVTILGHSGGCKIILTYLELFGDARLRAIVFSDDSPCHLRDGIFSADQALAAIDAFLGPEAISFSTGFSDQFLTNDAEESAKEVFYREGLKLPRPYMAKLFRWAAFGDWWDAYALVNVPTLVIGGRVSKVPVKIAQERARSVLGSCSSDAAARMGILVGRIAAQPHLTLRSRCSRGSGAQSHSAIAATRCRSFPACLEGPVRTLRALRRRSSRSVRVHRASAHE